LSGGYIPDNHSTLGERIGEFHLEGVCGEIPAIGGPANSLNAVITLHWEAKQRAGLQIPDQN
jgi:hypothetical protein